MMAGTFQRRSVAVAARYVHTTGWLVLMAMFMLAVVLVRML